MIPRVFYFETKFLSKEYIGKGGLDVFLGSKYAREIIRYKIRFYGIVAQEEGNTTLHLISPGETIYFLRENTQYCRWHNGPLEGRDDPLERRYCVREASTRTGFCMQHKDSLRAYYSLCFESMGIEGLRYCWLLDEKIGDRIEYAVYLLSYSVNGLKVGSTRYWRVVDRIAEQPHVLATVLYRFKNAVKTREIESSIGRLNGLTEVPRRTLRESLNTPVSTVVHRMDRIRERIEKVVKIKSEDNIPFRVEPGTDITYYVKAREANIENLLEKPLEIIDYYSGYLLLSEKNTNTYYIVKANKILHKNILKII